MAKTVRIDGLKETQDALRQLPDATARNVMRRVLKKNAEPFVTTAQAEAPVLTGNLRQRIRSGTGLSRRAKRAHRKVHRDDVELHIGPAPIHPKAVAAEFGTFKERAQPYMRPAWDSNRMSVVENIGSDLWSEINKTAQRLARRSARAAAKGR
jgi:HK97 gp10 family phage protein